MGEENKIRDAADAVKGIVEAVPVYQDALQPAAKEVGAALQTLAKTIHVALAPLSGLIWGYERIKDYLEQALTEKLRDVPHERIVTPNPAVAGPAVEALRFAANEPSLRELYANLLATSMDADTARNAHPAFVEIIRQMTADEARIIAWAALGERCALEEWGASTSDGRRIELRSRYYSLAEKAGVSFQELVPSYYDNLSRLGLAGLKGYDTVNIYYNPAAGFYWYNSIDKPNERTRLVEAERIEMVDQFLTGQLKREHPEFISIQTYGFILTSLGQQFCRACVPKAATSPSTH